MFHSYLTAIFVTYTNDRKRPEHHHERECPEQSSSEIAMKSESR